MSHSLSQADSSHAQVIGLPEYQAWMQGFPAGTTHILAAVNKGSAMLEGSATLQVMPRDPFLHVSTCIPVNAAAQPDVIKFCNA